MEQLLGNDQKFRGLYDRYFVAVRSYCLRRLPVSEVNDAVAETVLVVWRRIDDVPAESAVRPWIYTIAKNMVRNANRSLRRRARLNLRIDPFRSAPEPTPEILVVSSAENEEFLRMLAELRPVDQEILRLSFWDELSNAEIAQILDIEPHSVTMRLSRARSRLAHRLGMETTKQSTEADPRPVTDGGEL